MSDNLFTAFPERVDQIRKYSDLRKLSLPVEEQFGEKGTFASGDEAIEFYETSLVEMGRLAATEFKPKAAEIDQIGAVLKDGEVILPDALWSNLRRCAEFGVFAGSISKKYGGMALPRAIQMIGVEMFAQACPNTALTVANFSMGGIFRRATEEQRQKYLPKLVSLDVTTSMALTEPSAGSDLGRIRTSARRDGDHYVVNGTKLFISGGFGDLSFVLARTDPSSQGLNGLSVLIVPRKLESGKENFKVAKIEHKICLHASATCELLFENSVGELLGPEGDGFRVMLELMNEARLGMAACALGIAMGSLDEAKQYAKTRVTMGKPIIQHPMVADMLYEMEIETRAMRSMIIEASCAYDWMLVAEAKGNDKEYKRWKKRYRRLTPLAKYYCCEKAITIAKNALQIFGGYGVCTEYPAERLLREAIIYPIYEGTSQIQSLMVLKDTLKDVAQQATGFLGSLAGAWAESKVTRDPVKSRLLLARNELNQAIRTMLTSIIKDKFKADIEVLRQQSIQDFLKEFSIQLLSAKTDLTYPFLWAERFTRITCDYYSLKCMADHRIEGDAEWDRWIIEFANLAIPRMQLENHYMVNRLPSTLEYMKTLPKE